VFGPLQRLFRHPRDLRVWYHPHYRLPLAASEQSLGLDSRRPDDVLHFLVAKKVVPKTYVLEPQPASYAELQRVHSNEYLESLTDPKTLAGIYAQAEEEIVADHLLRSLRLAVGGTVSAARDALKHRRVNVNLLGGFHHAGKARGGGFCAVNDVAVAFRAVRADGFRGPVAVIDLDAHPPDGTQDCLHGEAWIGSLSGVDWGALEGVDETVLAPQTGDVEYLKALEQLLKRMPKPGLAFVLAGGDVLQGDRLGQLGLSLNGVRERDLKVAEALGEVPQVWLPAGGYSPYAWKALAGTVMALTDHTRAPVPPEYDPLAERFISTAERLDPSKLSGGPLLTEQEVAEALGMAPRGERRLLGYYSKEGLEYATEKFGILEHLRRLGYAQLHIEIEPADSGDRARLQGTDETSGQPVELVQLEVQRKVVAGGNFLFINWLALRNPRAHFSPARPKLPGQDVPGLGLAREMTQMTLLMAKRLTLDGVAFRPSWYHMAYAARYDGSRFHDPKRQGRFEALLRDLRELSLLDATIAVAEGKVLLDGAPYQWEAEEMVHWLDAAHAESDKAAIVAERDRCHFTLATAG
jgi:acetoin utilization deacetylase AcuC-like enzyme